VSETEAAPPKKSKKLIVIAAIVLLVVVLGGAAAWFFLSQRHAADEDEEGGAPRASQSATPKAPPTFLPLESMVVNLADPGGDRFAQIGITLELDDAKVAEQVKAYMPSIRSSVLLLVSQRTSDELLTRDGKEKLAADVRREVLRPLGIAPPKPTKRSTPRDEDDYDDEEPPRRRAEPNNPVRQVLFSSFIVQ